MTNIKQLSAHIQEPIDVMINLEWQTIKELAVQAYMRGKTFNELVCDILQERVNKDTPK